MGPNKPPQRKGRLPLYPRQRLEELQSNFDELEAQGVFSRTTRNWYQCGVCEPFFPRAYAKWWFQTCYCIC